MRLRRAGKNQQGLAKQIQSNIKFDMIDPTAIDVVQISVKKGEWMDEISDFSKQLDNFKFCK